jgi:hypothetical protein
MNTIKMLGLAAAAALSLGVGAAMAQEGPNDMVSGATAGQPQVPVMQAPAARTSAVQSGSSDVDSRTSVSPVLPGNPYGNLAGGG